MNNQQHINIDSAPLSNEAIQQHEDFEAVLVRHDHLVTSKARLWDSRQSFWKSLLQKFNHHYLKLIIMTTSLLTLCTILLLTPSKQSLPSKKQMATSKAISGNKPLSNQSIPKKNYAQEKAAPVLVNIKESALITPSSLANAPSLAVKENVQPTKAHITVRSSETNTVQQTKGPHPTNDRTDVLPPFELTVEEMASLGFTSLRNGKEWIYNNRFPAHEEFLIMLITRFGIGLHTKAYYMGEVYNRSPNLNTLQNYEAQGQTLDNLKSRERNKHLRPVVDHELNFYPVFVFHQENPIKFQLKGEVKDKNNSGLFDRLSQDLVPIQLKQAERSGVQGTYTFWFTPTQAFFAAAPERVRVAYSDHHKRNVKPWKTLELVQQRKSAAAPIATSPWVESKDTNRPNIPVIVLSDSTLKNLGIHNTRRVPNENKVGKKEHRLLSIWYLGLTDTLEFLNLRVNYRLTKQRKIQQGAVVYRKEKGDPEKVNLKKVNKLFPPRNLVPSLLTDLNGHNLITGKPEEALFLNPLSTIIPNYAPPTSDELNTLIPIQVKECYSMDCEGIIFWFKPSVELFKLLPKKVREELSQEYFNISQDSSLFADINFKQHHTGNSSATSACRYFEVCRSAIPGMHHLKMKQNEIDDQLNLSFQLSDKKDILFQLVSLDGKRSKTIVEQRSYKAGKHELKFEKGQIEHGIYLLTASAGTEKLTRRVVIH